MIIWGELFFEVGKKCVGVPPPPLPAQRLFRAGAAFQSWRSSCESFGPLYTLAPPLTIMSNEVYSTYKINDIRDHVSTLFFRAHYYRNWLRYRYIVIHYQQKSREIRTVSLLRFDFPPPPPPKAFSPWWWIRYYFHIVLQSVFKKNGTVRKKII